MKRYYPDRAVFASIPPGPSGTRVPVYRRLLGDRLTPVSAFSLLTDGDAADHAFLLESVVGGEFVGRYSLLGVGPSLVYEVRRGESADPLADLRRILGDRAYHRDPALPGFTGGLVGFAGYDLVRYYEPDKLGGPDGGPKDDRGLPDVLFGLYDESVIFDHVDKSVRVVSHAILEDGIDPAAAYEDACLRVDGLVEKLAGTPNLTPGEIETGGPLTLEYEANLDRAGYESAVSAGVEYIRAGDIFQFVPSRRLRVKSRAKPLDVYRALRVINPSPFMVYLKTPACTLIGNSPEILCRVRAGVVTTRPLAGTRRRGGTPAEDDALAAELLADPKERAEHTMLVDLHRNDVGRVAKVGSVHIDDLMSVEKYSHVMHIVTNVVGELDAKYDALDALRVSLPVGTVSGAPKVRAMQIIDEVEPTRRGPYGGAVGHVDFSGDMDTCIALRTIVYQDGNYDVQAGAGVVADSVPASEYEEVMNKARAMLKAVEVAERGFGG